MPPTINGVKNRPIKQVEGRGETDRFGLDMFEEVEEVPDSVFPWQMRAKGSVHPRFTSMQMEKRSFVRGRAGTFWRVSYTYVGYMDSLPEPTYDLQATLDQQPIQLHPRFVTDIGGKPSAPLNGASFIDPKTGQPTDNDDVGVFREFKASLTGAYNPKAGIEAFSDPGAVWTKTYYATDRPTALRNIGTIEGPSGPNPSLSGRTWLLWETSYRKRGFIYEIRESWKLSGDGGWDVDIYTA